MRNNKQFGISGKGYYIALILCAAAIGISGYLYYRNTTETEEVSLMETQPGELPAGTEAPEEVEVLVTLPGKKPAEKPTPKAENRTPTETTAPTAPAPKQPLKTAAPVQGEQIGGYAMDCLSYNETTRDWRVHNGIDIAAPEGTEVCAAADGTVHSVTEDDVMGCTVEILHEGGYTTCYSSLGAEPTVKPGDTVRLGQAIGCVGSTALTETALGSHVHFSVMDRNGPMDPEAFLAAGDN